MLNKLLNWNPGGAGTVAVTYANDVLLDGAGAQLQRIYATYAISRLLNIPYVHSPLIRLGYQGVVALENDCASPDAVADYNRVFHIRSDIEPPPDAVIHNVSEPDVDFIGRIAAESERDGKFHLVRIVYPYAITDRHPESYGCLKAISPFPRTRTGVFRIAIHVRRGELEIVAPERILPNSYYISCALNLIAALGKAGIPFVCELYTEVPSKAFTVTPRHIGMQGRVHPIKADHTLDPKTNALEDFDAVPNLVRCVNLDPIKTMGRMATADALILSRSSFSYLPALFNTQGIIVYHPFRHSPLAGWLVSDGNGNVNGEELARRIDAWERRSGG